jgi:phosphate-selective porin OprO/OprP
MAALGGLLIGAAAPAAAQTPPPAAEPSAGSGGSQIRSADGAFVIRARGYVHEDGRFFLAEEGAGTSTFVLRRARPILEGTLFRSYEFRIMPDFGGGTASLQEAWLDARYHPALRVRVGKYKEPFGLERLQSATAISFVERALPTALAPNRDVGVQLWGDVSGGLVSYAVGVFNGVPDGGSADVDTNDGKDLAARLFVQPFRTIGGPLAGLGVGVAVTTGEQEGAVGATGLAGYRSSGQQTFFAYRADATAAGTVLPDGRRTRVSPQGFWYAGPFGVLGELVRVRQELRRDATAAELESSAWQAAGSVVLTGEAAAYAGLRPASVFDPTAGTWGALELTGRVTAFEADADAFPLFADPARSVSEARAWAVGLNWYLNQNVKVVLNYERTGFTGGAAAGADRPDEQGFFTRVQLAF